MVQNKNEKINGVKFDAETLYSILRDLIKDLIMCYALVSYAIKLFILKY